MSDRVSIRKWIENYNKGCYSINDFKTQCEAGWYDWFCRDESLVNKTKKLSSIIKKIQREDLLDNYYVFFANRCPVLGPLYDCLKICDLETGDVIFSISIGDKRCKFNYTVYGRANDFEKALFETNSVKELGSYLNNVKEL